MAANHSIVHKKSHEEENGVRLINFIRKNDLNAVEKQLNDSSVGLERLDAYANSPLLIACHLGYSQIVKRFIEFGANYKRINIFGKLFLATKFQEMLIILLLFSFHWLFFKNHFRTKLLIIGSIFW